MINTYIPKDNGEGYGKVTDAVLWENISLAFYI